MEEPGTEPGGPSLKALYIEEFACCLCGQEPQGCHSSWGADLARRPGERYEIEDGCEEFGAAHWMEELRSFDRGLASNKAGPAELHGRLRSWVIGATEAHVPGCPAGIDQFGADLSRGQQPHHT